MRSRFCSLILVVLLVLGVSACSAITPKPTVIINSPPHGSQFHEGEDIAFQSTATDAKGVARVELVVNGTTVRTDSPPSSQGQTSFTLVQTWKATQGTHTIAVRAYNTANVMSDPATISISVAAPNTPAATAPPAATATTAVPATTAPPLASTPTATNVTSAATCTNNAAFVADVTVPDGTAFVPNQAFNKIWRVKNTGTCAWADGYLFVFTAGELMATTTSIAVPNTVPGVTADLLIPMTAPAALGTHTGQWRLKGPSGAVFGATLNVTIKVIDTSVPAAPPPSSDGPTATPTTVPAGPSGGCTGAPTITSFTASPTSLFVSGAVVLNWGAVTNADTVEIDGGVGGVGTPGSLTVNVTPPKTFTLTAKCGSTTATRQVTISKSNLLVPIQPILPLFTVTDVGISSSTSGMITCGGKNYQFTGSITATGTGDAQYRWEKNGASVKTGSVHFNGSGTLAVSPYSMTATLGDKSGSVRLHVTSPGDKSSPSMNYSCINIIGP